MLTVFATAWLVTILPAATGDTIADQVLGQQDFLHRFAQHGGWRFAQRAEFRRRRSPGHHLYLSDTKNNRVLGWRDLATFVNGEPADLVLGQPDFFSDLENGNGGPNANPLNYSSPEGVAVDSNGNLYVADPGNNRVLEYNAPYQSHARAFHASDAAQRCLRAAWGLYFATDATSAAFTVAASADSLCAPQGIAVDAHDNLYVADASNNRVARIQHSADDDRSCRQRRYHGRLRFRARLRRHRLLPIRSVTAALGRQRKLPLQSGRGRGRFFGQRVHQRYQQQPCARIQ